MKPILGYPAPSPNRGTRGSFFWTTRSLQFWSLREKACHCWECLSYNICVDHHGIPHDNLQPIISLTHCDILPCVISSDLRKRDPVRRFQREPILRRKGHAAQDSEHHHNDHNPRDVSVLRAPGGGPGRRAFLTASA